MAAESRRRSTMWSSSRFTSSTYSMFLLACASTPGSNLFLPVCRTCSKSRVPAIRSSVALNGSSTTRIGPLSVSCLIPSSRALMHSEQSSSGWEGSQRNLHPFTYSISGNTCARDLTAVDLAVPFSPLIRTPPTPGSTMLRMRALFISSWSTIAVKGNERFFEIIVTGRQCRMIINSIPRNMLSETY